MDRTKPSLLFCVDALGRLFGDAGFFLLPNR
jgi:hypothetical protein